MAPRAHRHAHACHVLRHLNEAKNMGYGIAFDVCAGRAILFVIDCCSLAFPETKRKPKKKGGIR